MEILKKAAVNFSRIVIALTFIITGFVKAVDPSGTQYKITDYLEAFGMQGMFPDMLILGCAVVLSAIEFVIGCCMLFAIRRRFISRLLLIVMSGFTMLTIWQAVADPISDCGCFGDAIKLTNWQTVWKNVALLIATIIVCRWPMSQMRFISKSNQWIVLNYASIYIIFVSLHSLYTLPLFDFRPYYIGANIKKGMEIPPGAPQPQFTTTFIMEKDGTQKEFSIDNYPDSTWTFVSSRTVQTETGYVPPIHDFSITRHDNNEDITASVLDSRGYTFLLTAPFLEQADDSNFDRINAVYEYARENDYPFYCLTASNMQGIERWKDITGAEYPFCQTDDITLKTIIRSNPGLVLIKDGTIIRKWGNNQLPDEETLNGRLETIAAGRQPADNTAEKILSIILWFIMPLTVLTIADRLWAWTKWLKNKEKSNRIYQLLKRKK